MKGRAHQLFEEFRRQAAANGNSFGVCRVILIARVIPEKLTPDIDDPALEGRLEQAIVAVLGNKRGPMGALGRPQNDPVVTSPARS